MEILAGQAFPIAGYPTIEIATDSKRSLLNGIEAELQNSEVYQKVLGSLKTMLGEAGAKADGFLAVVGREAIQLAFKKFAKKYRSELQSLAAANMSSESQNLEKDEPKDKLESKAKEEVKKEETVGDEEKEKVEVEVVSSAENEEKDGEQTPETHTELAGKEPIYNNVASSTTETNSSEKNDKMGEMKKGSGSPKKKKKKKLTKAEKAALEKAEKRKEILEGIGQELRKARITRCLSIQQLHSQTLVPLNHLDALEKGNIEKLPEDIYVRGFISRLGNALGLDGEGMAATLPVADPLQGMIPSWSPLDSNSSLGLELRPLHLYLGYTALMAGAVGGLTAVTQHSTPGAKLMPQLPDGDTEAIARSHREIEVTAIPGLQFSDSGIAVGSDMAPPEMME